MTRAVKSGLIYIHKTCSLGNYEERVDVCYLLLDLFSFGRIGARRERPRRRDVLSDSQQLLSEDVQRLPVASHGLGAVPDALC